eukprot:TRINITY_DN33795_c0_g1_i1.p1 TRINITY_DN33795_c0_g1~~TRINITY_DN33795_c0_g1_i1.p1  ORF type:complete len:296 (-),score=38.62 TRINITY_DN33795_c0_g1_i1:260-1147(-)
MQFLYICLCILNVLPHASKLGDRDGLKIHRAQGQTRLSSSSKTAVCATGHIRSLVLPSVHKSLKDNLLDTTNADLFLVGGLGKSPTESGQGTMYDAWRATQKSTEVLSEGSSEIQAVLNYLKPTYYELHLNGCTELQKAWATTGVKGRVCREGHRGDGNFLQVMWVDHCFHKVRDDPKINYDLIIRTRPDVGIFQKMQPALFPRTRIGFMTKEEGVGLTDWFMSFPKAQLPNWWDHTVQEYLAGWNEMLDANKPPTDERQEVRFPVVIVRHPDNAKCDSLPWDDLLRQCKQTHWF